MKTTNHLLTRSFPEQSYMNVWLIPAIMIPLLVLVSFYNYLLFHALAELFAIGVSALMAVVAWQTYSYSKNNFLMFLASGYFWIGALDLVHTLIYKGMNIYPIYIANPATQFWIAARYSESILLLVAPLFLVREINRYIAFIGFGLVAVVIYILIMSGNFPDAFIEGKGLSQFKVNSEYLIISIMAAALVHLFTKRKYLASGVLNLLVLSVILTMTAELFFTFYVSVYGLSNLAGHILKFVSFWLIFSAIIRVNLKMPYIAMTKEVAERKQAEETIRESLKEKEVLLNEIHHRVKNNLQVIYSLLSLQASNETDSHTLDALEESRRRVKVMARIHENLHRSDDLTFINISDYLNTVMEDTKESNGVDPKVISFHLDADDFNFDVEQAIALGQIISELVSNCLKHAFPNSQPGKIEVSLHRVDVGKIKLRVADDGKGLPEDINLQQTKTLGMKLIHALAMQLGGTVNVESSGGTRIQIIFPEKPS